MKAQWRRRVTPRLPEWTGPTAGSPSALVVEQRDGDQLRLTAESVGWLRQRLSAGALSGRTRHFELVVAGWRPPWAGWSGRLGPLPGLVQHEVRLPPDGSGPATVRVVLAAPAPLDRIVAAVLPVLHPWHPMPAPVTPELSTEAETPSWLAAEERRTDAAGIGPRDKAVRPYDLQLAMPGAEGQTGADAFLTSPYGVRAPGGTETILVDATTANPRGRERYGPDLPAGRLRLVGEGDAIWWRVTRPGDGTAIVVAGRVGEPLDERQKSVLARLGGVVTAELPIDIPPAATAAAIAQLAMCGVSLHTPELADAPAALLAPDLLTVVRAQPPGREADPVEWEIRSIAQRRAALRHHATGFAWPRAITSEYPALGRPPTVTALLVTRRPGHVLGALSALAAQTYPALEIVVGLHGCELAPTERAQLAELDMPVQVLSIPAELNLGEALAEATRWANGSVISKVDDDDLYGPEHIWDLVLARHYSNATIVGKGAEFVYLEPRDVTVRRYMGSELYTDVVAGGTMLLSRADLETVGGWRPLARSVDRGLLDRVLQAGGLVYRTHGFGFIYTRHSNGHTWDPGLDYFLHDPRSAWPGLPPYAEFGAR